MGLSEMKEKEVVLMKRIPMSLTVVDLTGLDGTPGGHHD
jgi:hypothetical protein